MLKSKKVLEDLEDTRDAVHGSAPEPEAEESPQSPERHPLPRLPQHPALQRLRMSSRDEEEPDWRGEASATGGAGVLFGGRAEAGPKGEPIFHIRSNDKFGRGVECDNYLELDNIFKRPVSVTAQMKATGKPELIAMSLFSPVRARGTGLTLQCGAMQRLLILESNGRTDPCQKHALWEELELGPNTKWRTYRIDATDSEVRYYVDDELQAVHPEGALRSGRLQFIPFGTDMAVRDIRVLTGEAALAAATRIDMAAEERRLWVFEELARRSARLDGASKHADRMLEEALGMVTKLEAATPRSKFVRASTPMFPDPLLDMPTPVRARRLPEPPNLGSAEGSCGLCGRKEQCASSGCSVQ